MPLINIVRKEEHVRELEAMGAAHVLNSTSATFKEDLAGLAHELNATLILDAVTGGQSALLLDAAPRETLLHTLGRTVARTSRQVRALERRVEPGLASASARISGLLEEREREDQARLRHFLTVQQGPIP